MVSDAPESDAKPETAPEVTPSPEAPPELFLEQPPPTPTLWSGRDLLLFIVFAFFAAVLCSFLTLVGYQALKPIFGWHTPFEALATNAFFNIALSAILYVPVLAYIYYLVSVRYRLPFWSGLGWHPLGPGKAVRFALLGVLLSVAMTLAPTLLPDKTKFPLEELLNSPAAGYALAAFAIFVAPLMEELIFRGVLFAFFERLASVEAAVALTAVLFAALHIPEYRGAWNHLLMLLFVAFAFSLARGVTKSLAPSVVLHMSYNATQMIVLFFGSHHFRDISGMILG